MFVIILIVPIVLILGVSTFMYFKLSKQPIISSTQSSIPSTT